MSGVWQEGLKFELNILHIPLRVVYENPYTTGVVYENMNREKQGFLF